MLIEKQEVCLFASRHSERRSREESSEVLTRTVTGSFTSAGSAQAYFVPQDDVRSMLWMTQEGFVILTPMAEESSKVLYSKNRKGQSFD